MNLFEYALKIEQDAVLELLKKFSLESLRKFRLGDGYCYAHIKTGVGYKCSMHFDDSGVTYEAVPGIYFPQPDPPED